MVLEEWMRLGKMKGRRIQGGHPLTASSETGVHTVCAGTEW